MQAWFPVCWHIDLPIKINKRIILQTQGCLIFPGNQGIYLLCFRSLLITLSMVFVVIQDSSF